MSNKFNLSATLENKASIQTLLEYSNGKAKKFCFNSAEEIIELAAEAEKKCEALGLAKSKRPGAIYQAESGQPVAKSYDSARNANRIQLIRKKDNWAIASIEKIMIYPQQGGSRNLIVTKSQADYMVEKFSSQFTVAGE
jgi:hypothetical protein